MVGLENLEEAEEVGDATETLAELLNRDLPEAEARHLKRIKSASGFRGCGTKVIINKQACLYTSAKSKAYTDLYRPESPFLAGEIRRVELRLDKA